MDAPMQLPRGRLVRMGSCSSRGWRSPQGLRHFLWLIRRSQTFSLGIALLDRCTIQPEPVANCDGVCETEESWNGHE